MATFKTIIEPHYKRADGTYNVRIQVTHNRKIKRISTQYFLSQQELTRSLKIKDQSYIDALNDTIKEYRTICNRYGERLKFMTVEEVVEIIKNNHNQSTGLELDFISYGKNYAKKLKNAGRIGSAKLYEVALNSLTKYTARKQLYINEINTKFLTSYIEWINSQPSATKREKGQRAPSLYLTYIRALHNAAKAEYNDEDRGIIKIPFSPFKQLKFPKAPVTRKRALTIEQLQQIIDMPYKDDTLSSKRNQCNRFNLAKDVFLLSFGMLGINSADLFGSTMLTNNRVIYQRAKTKARRDDNAEMSVRIEPQIQPIFDKYVDTEKERVFNFYRHYSNQSTFNSAINKGLKEIGELIGVDDLEFYAARHSWATIARNKAKIDLHTVHNALNHVDESMKVTDIYLEKDYTLNDEANEKVLAFFDFSRMPITNPQER